MCLALVRYELRDREGRIWSLDTRGPRLVLTNVEVVRAVVHHRREPRATLVYPYPGRLRRGQLDMLLHAWELCEQWDEEKRGAS